MKQLLVLLARNKHTSLAGVAFFALEPAAQLAALWFPQHKDQVEQSAKIIKGAVGAYGLLMAGDANAGASKDDVDKLSSDLKDTQQAVVSGDTSHLTKSSVESKPTV